MVGKIIKGIAGFYSVRVPGKGVYECKARGVFRKEKIKPLIGDSVEIAVVDEAGMLGNVEKILDRHNQLTRPAVANLDQAVIVFAVSQPDPNYDLLDRFLVMTDAKGIDALICFNKIDLLPGGQLDTIVGVYERIGYTVVSTSFREGRGIEELKTALHGKTSVFAGPSGVGKSSILNLVQDEMVLKTGAVSGKIGRGKHTTRHVELICFDDESYVVDTPGFSSLNMDGIGVDQLKHAFREFADHEPYCKFTGCNHLNEPQCGVRKAVASGEITQIRYESYTELLDEVNSLRIR